MALNTNSDAVRLSVILDKLLTLKDELFDIGKVIFDPNGIGLIASDIFIIGAIKKSHSITSGFVSLMTVDNYVAAAPLVRIHLDTLLRIHALYISDNREEFTLNVLKGITIRNLKDAKGNKMTDRYLVDTMNEFLPGFKNVYDEYNGFVHLSDKHIWSSTSFNEDYAFSGLISAEDINIPVASKIKAAKDMSDISKAIHYHLKSYADGKIVSEDIPK